jgi:long-chain fatty acid transport protein
VHVNLASLESQRATNHVDQEGSVHLLMDGISVGAHVGLFAELSENAAVGLTYQSRSRIRMRGDADFEVPLEFQARFPDQGVRADFPLPDRIALGLRVSATPEVDLYSDLSVTLWSVNDQLVIDFDEDVTDDSVRVSDWKTTAALRLGADAQLGMPELRGRAGFFVDGLFGSPAPSSTVSPTAPDSVRIGATGGLSYEVRPSVTLDVSYQYLRLLPRSSTSQDAPLARYEGSAHILGIGARFFHDMGEAR